MPDFTVSDEFISKVQGDKTLLDENIDIILTLQRCNITHRKTFCIFDD